MSRKIYNQVEVGRFVESKRKELNLTQEQIAKKLGVTKTAVSNWENGIAMIDVKYIASLANVFSVKVDDILFPDYTVTNKEYNYSAETFKNMLRGKLDDKKIYNKLILKYIENKTEIVNMLYEYEKTKEITILDKLNEINMFGFNFVGGHSFKLLSIEYYENELKPVVLQFDNSVSFENLIETFWWTEFDMRSNIFSNILGRRKESIINKELDYVFKSRVFMLDFIYNNCSEMVFNKYINTFTQNYKEKLLTNMLMTNQSNANKVIDALRKAVYEIQ